MLVGAGVCLTYMALNQAGLREALGLPQGLGDWRWFGIEPRAAGVFGVPAGAAALVLVSLLTRPPEADELALVDRLRQPGTPPSRPYSGSQTSL
jgi:cation/acetate symporter